MIEDIKREISDLIQNYVNLQVFAMYPKTDAKFPCACVDVVSMIGDVKIGAEIHSFLVRISIFSNNRLELDQLTDKVIDTLAKHANELTNCYYNGVKSISPTLFAFENRDDKWRRDIDIRVISILRRI